MYTPCRNCGVDVTPMGFHTRDRDNLTHRIPFNGKMFDNHKENRLEITYMYLCENLADKEDKKFIEDTECEQKKR